MTSLPARLQEKEYQRFRNLILERSGLHFAENRRTDLERGLLRAFARSGCPDLEHYHAQLSQNHTGSQEWEQLIAHLTVGETYFFRDRAQFEALEQHILPEIVARKQARGRQIRIWSVGCASGEEPYSLAMLLRDLVPNYTDWHITILASDINREALAKARAGLYGAWSFREKGWERMKQRYFRHQEPLWEIAAHVRETVTFSYINLAEDAYPSLSNNTAAFDLIVCRNVTIYFAADLVQQVIERLYDALVEEGWLIVGHSEPAPTNYAAFQAHAFPGTIAYQKTSQPAAHDLSWLKAAGEPVQPQAAARPSMAAPPPSKAVPAQITPLPVDLCAEAQALMNRGQEGEALERLHQALQENPSDAYACYLVAKIRADGGHWEEARSWCERALEHDTLLAEAHFLLGLICLQEQDLEQALAEMRRVVYLDRSAVLGHFWLANLYRESGEQDRALKSLHNTRRLLERISQDTSIPWSDGMTAGRLLYAVRRQIGEEQTA